MTTPCKDCPNRHETCHVDCEPYHEFAKLRREQNKRPYDLAREVLFNGIAKANHRKQRKVKMR